jgi:hypothetical protein
MQRVKNMDKSFKFVYFMIILFSLFIVSTQMTYKRTIFISFLNFLLYFVSNILSHFNNMFSLFFSLQVYFDVNVIMIVQVFSDFIEKNIGAVTVFVHYNNYKAS